MCLRNSSSYTTAALNNHPNFKVEKITHHQYRKLKDPRSISFNLHSRNYVCVYIRVYYECVLYSLRCVLPIMYTQCTLNPSPLPQTTIGYCVDVRAFLSKCVPDYVCREFRPNDCYE